MERQDQGAGVEVCPGSAWGCSLLRARTSALCLGPVEYSASGVAVVVEHNYCGGARFLAVTTGELVHINGGDLTGTYRVNGARRLVPRGSSTDVLLGLGDVVLQSCQGGGIGLVGLTRIN